MNTTKPTLVKSTPYNHTHTIKQVFPNAWSHCTICGHFCTELNRLRKEIAAASE